MNNKLKIIISILSSLILIINTDIVLANADNGITFKDKHLQKALCKFYDWDGNITKEDADKLSMKDNGVIILENLKIANLEGLQYFSSLGNIFLRGNNLKNLKPLSKLKRLIELDISNNSIKGIKFENSLKDMGMIENLRCVILSSNELTNIEILESIRNIDTYELIDMENNKIRDISILENATNLEILDLSNNLISEVAPLKNLKKLTFYLDLRDNCIIDYKPIKPLLDEMFSDVGNETGLERYDYYSNPVNFEYDGKTIKFPYLTAYYKYQAYAEAIPLLKALGGSAEYIKGAGILICRYKDKVIGLADFSDRYIMNGEVKSMDYPMRRMQYDLAYVPVKDICEALGLNYNVTEEREIYPNGDDVLYAPKYVEISAD